MRPVSTRFFRLATVLVVAVAGASACSDADKTDSGGVLLLISDFGTLPITHSLTNPVAPAGSLLQIDSITVRNIASNPSAATSELMTVRVEGYEVTYRRRDSGTRVPRALFESIFGQITVNGTIEFNGLNMLELDQLFANPLADLATDGVDSETGSTVIVMDINLRFFGRTLGGTEVASNVESFTVQFVQ